MRLQESVKLGAAERRARAVGRERGSSSADSGPGSSSWSDSKSDLGVKCGGDGAEFGSWLWERGRSCGSSSSVSEEI